MDELAREFVCVRITRMAGVDLSLFEFDYDLTWQAFFLNDREEIYSRFGGRDGESATSLISIEALKNTMRRVLAVHRERMSEAAAAPEPRESYTIEDLPGAVGRQVECYHCHMVNNFQIEHEYATLGEFDRTRVFAYPPPANVGLVMDRDEGNVVAEVVAESAAEEAGVQPGDVIVSANDVAVLSQGDLQWVLHHSERESELHLELERGGRAVRRGATLRLSGDWRVSDISWRASMWSLRPDPGFWAPELSEAERREQRIGEEELALRVQFINQPYAQAVLRNNDIVVALDGDRTRRRPQELHAYVRLNYDAGDELELTIVREGRERTVRYRMGE